MNYKSNKTKSVFTVYLILTFYYLGVLVMLYTITYPPFNDVHENFKQHAIVLQNYLLWILYLPGVFMFLSTVALTVLRPIHIPKWAVIVSLVLSLISVASMFINMLPLHQHWITSGFGKQTFDQSNNITLAFQIVPSTIQALIAITFAYIHLRDLERTTRILFTSLIVLCFAPMGTIVVECHLNYALWATVASSDWPAYRKAMDMPVFLAVFLIPFYFPIVLLIVLIVKKRAGLSRGLSIISLITLAYVFVVSAAYFVPDLQFELDKHYSEELLQELIRNEIWLRTPAELAYWATVIAMLWKVRPDHHEVKQIG